MNRHIQTFHKEEDEEESNDEMENDRADESSDESSDEEDVQTQGYIFRIDTYGKLKSYKFRGM